MHRVQWCSASCVEKGFTKRTLWVPAMWIYHTSYCTIHNIPYYLYSHIMCAHSMQSYLSWFLFFSSHPLCFVCLFMYVLSFDCSTMLYRAVRAEIFTSLCLYFCFSLVDIFIYSSSLGFLFFFYFSPVLFYPLLYSVHPCTLFTGK